ncbi:MAG: sugar kinase [Desulfobacteraceae bacterium]|nr:sugar kinase [Desulfobacteraceae bacterium]
MIPDIITLGEPLIEFSAAKEGGLSQNSIFYQGFGGDTSNFAVSAARSGARVGYITAIGNDPFGKALMNLWQQENIDVTTVQTTDQYKTGIYFISRNNGTHMFTYFRKDSAASRMTPDILPVRAIQNAKIFHLSGITQGISTSACDTAARAIAIANEAGTLVSYDPNLRTDLWHIDRARAIIHDTVPKTDILYPSFEDACLLTGLKTPEEILDFYHNMGAKTVVLKLGEKGALLGRAGEKEYFAPFQVDPVDASGAGDTFCGAFAAEYVNKSSIDTCVKYACTAAALSTMGIGCVASIPSRKKIAAAMDNKK